VAQQLDGGVVVTASEVQASEYLPNKGVFLGQLIGNPQGPGFGLYKGRIEPGCELAREIHPENSETVYILSGEAVGLVGEREVPLCAGQMLHVHKNIHHGLRNAGAGPLEFLVIGHPDFV
jgi:mannose-6-phosphate isomerase-like protein (cupin superfamily)